MLFEEGEKMQNILGITFKDGEEIPNFGSIELDGQSSLNKKYYTLKSEDIDKLDLLLDKRYSVTGSGSMAYVVDTKQLYICHGGAWFEV